MPKSTNVLITATLHVASATVTKLIEKEILSLDDALSIFETTYYAVQSANWESDQQDRLAVLASLRNYEEHCKWLSLKLQMKQRRLRSAQD
ncbi:MAG: hypothetical protein MJK10_16310 [Pseudomonadales bacterium]|nr:hypothetical protein [Pseudomonadales bacterium]NRA17696.1 hypothetical protein [Oceanospirillaceae bacterium]